MVTLQTNPKDKEHITVPKVELAQNSVLDQVLHHTVVLLHSLQNQETRTYKITDERLNVVFFNEANKDLV